TAHMCLARARPYLVLFLVPRLNLLKDFLKVRRRLTHKPPMITSFADGTKLSMEATILANATGFGVAQRGMEGPSYEHVRDMVGHFDLDRLLAGGLVDYVLGAEPGTGPFVVGYGDNPIRPQDMSYFTLRRQPLYLSHR